MAVNMVPQLEYYQLGHINRKRCQGLIDTKTEIDNALAALDIGDPVRSRAALERAKIAVDAQVNDTEPDLTVEHMMPPEFQG